MTGTASAAEGAAAAPPAPAGEAGPASPSGRQVWRSARGPVIVGLALLVVAVILVVARGGTPTGYLEPDAANPSGSRALATLLEKRGVQIEPVSTVRAARRAMDPGELLLVVRSEVLSERQLSTLAGLPGDRLLVAPSKPALRALAPGITIAARAPVRIREPRCGLQAAALAGTAETGGMRYRGNGAATWRCYPAEGTPSLVRRSRTGHTVTVVGTGVPFTNRHLDKVGNAALTMNLVGSAPAVVWLVPDPLAGGQPAGRPGSLYGLIPTAVVLAAVQLGVAVVLLALWRARRLGPVVFEQLPVVVRAAETVEGRARLYRSQRARGRAAEALRGGCQDRLLPRLGLSGDADPHAVVEALTSRTGWSAPYIDALLYDPPPQDDAALVRLADDLDALEARVTGHRGNV